MERQLTDEQLSELCIYMRIIDLSKANEQVVDKSPAFKQDIKLLCKKVEEIMAILSEEEQDMVLEEHRLQLQQIQEAKVSKKRTKKRKKWMDTVEEQLHSLP